jgi:hypothetical protein
MATPRQMTDHTLDAVKGWMPGNMGSIDCSGKLSASVTIDPVYAGRVVHKNDANEFEMGVVGTQMAIFLLQNSDDSDVSNAGGNLWQSISSRGTMSGLVAIGGYELADTEFDSTLTYHVNDPLRAIASNSSATTGGRLTNASFTFGTTAYVGVVSKLPTLNSDKVNVITFWAVYAPAATL